MKKKYDISLDVGTNSVGWAVTDNNYNLIRYKKQNMWGSRLFESGKTAEERRSFRSTRRRMARRKNRSALLKQIIGDVVLEEDPVFFIRMKEASLHKEDRKNSNSKNNLFVCERYNDKDYYKEYPTIYHLRKKLIESNEKEDIRLVYLAIHHIIKYRGNFLYEGQKLEGIAGNIEETLENLFDELIEREIININSPKGDIIKTLENRNISKKRKVEQIIVLEKKSNSRLDKNKIQQLFNGIIGLKFDIKKIFNVDIFKEKSLIKFSDDDIEEKLVKLEECLGDNYIIIELMKKIYSWTVLNGVLQGEKQISIAKVNSYEKYKEDLKALKSIIKNNFEVNIYTDLFKSKYEKTISYYNYSNNKYSKDVSDNDFYKKIKEILEKNEVSDEYKDSKKYVLSQIEMESFLVKQNITSNGAIPYQLNKNELEMIIDKQGRYYPILKEAKGKIIKLLTFRVPYYVGPLNPKSEFAWIEKIEGKESEKIYPWNFEEIVDIDKSAEGFITKMTNQCTYLPEETVIPKCSLLYSDYNFYNEINKIRIGGKLLDIGSKEKLRKELFLEQKSVSEKDIFKWAENNNFGVLGDCKIEGLQGDKKANASLAAYKDFKSILGDIDENNVEMIEKIIYWLTIFEDKKIIKRKIVNTYPELAKDEKNLNRILNFKYTGWSRLSEKLLNGIYIEDQFRYKTTIIRKMKKSNMNFMQIINDEKLGFDKKISKAKNTEDIQRIDYKKHIKDLPGSPSIKRGIWQSIKIVEEVIKIIGCKPQRIYLEFARGDDDSKRTMSRKGKLIKLYKDIEGNKDIVKELNNKDIKIDTDRQYLYFIQQGKCMYSQESLDFGKLYEYEIDHIIPQSYIKDNSIENKVLVKRKKNQEKSQNKLSSKIIDSNRDWWGILKKQALIGIKKYTNLTRYDSFSENENKGFINRQLVETRQILMHVTELLMSCYGEDGTKVIPIKAQLVNDFKSQFDIYKNRDVNDHHHAKDAYIAGVVGNYIMNRFKSLDKEFIYDEFNRYKKKSAEKNKFGFIISSMNYSYVDEETGEAIWEKNDSIGKIKKILRYNDCKITKKTSFNTGNMFNQNASKKLEVDAKNKEKTQLKNNLDVCKYGYYDGEQQGYYTIISYKKRKKNCKELVGIPIRITTAIGDSEKKLKEYLITKGYTDVEIIKNKVPKYQHFKNEKGEFYLASSVEWHNAKQLTLDIKYDGLINRITKFKISDSDEKTEDELVRFYEYYIEKLEKQYPIFNTIAIKLSENIDAYRKLILEEKIKIIKELLKITGANAVNGNLGLIKGTNREGRLNGKSINIEKTTFIYESVTGLFVKECRY
ncbi:type II CRISPR RNA-guided endonuclease Cas9 [Clostridium estertheticum]|uniref:type II CRISPR RNA-guided endonuclease Cas9 n=1 Tax=Clostridium estertheticum TaxID=238834 RepID=UPI0013EE4721|nr:type II CRISPR RNA-guided endonuclease Cas9 [Clostridium estertheticum]MBZ9607277.1 type II CRISPR RNA-guided endonuclease Cas9 [Clostridium estertheticum]